MKQAGESLLESPQSLRMSLAAAMTLGFKRSLFYKNARLYCINLLLTYRSGCAARCAYCGLSTNRYRLDRISRHAILSAVLEKEHLFIN